MRGYHVQDEESLVRRAREGDSGAFAEIYETYFDRIYRYIAFKMGDRLEAEDLAEQVFLKALESIRSFKWRGVPFASWLFRIAHNQIVDYLRKKAKKVELPLQESVVSGELGPEEWTQLRLSMEQLHAALERLTEAQRRAISLRFGGGLSIAETAKAMGKNEGAVRALQHSGLVALRKVLAL